jgi:hypothetical protein
VNAARVLAVLKPGSKVGSSTVPAHTSKNTVSSAPWSTTSCR